MRSRSSALLLLPLVLTLAVAAWVLSVRGSGSGPGGYCANATVVVVELFGRAETADDVGLGPLPSLTAMVAKLDQVDLTPLQVGTPPSIRDDVSVLVPDHNVQASDAELEQALAQVVGDYLGRCRTA